MWCVGITPKVRLKMLLQIVTPVSVTWQLVCRANTLLHSTSANCCLIQEHLTWILGDAISCEFCLYSCSLGWLCLVLTLWIIDLWKDFAGEIAFPLGNTPFLSLSLEQQHSILCIFCTISIHAELLLPLEHSCPKGLDPGNKVPCWSLTYIIEIQFRF